MNLAYHLKSLIESVIKNPSLSLMLVNQKFYFENACAHYLPLVFISYFIMILPSIIILQIFRDIIAVFCLLLFTFVLCSIGNDIM